MIVALAAARQINRDIAYNLKQMERFMHRAKESGADLVCFGETFLQGFDCFDWNFLTDRHTAVSVQSDEFRQVCRMSADIGIDVLFGFAELDGETIYSSAALIAEGKPLEVYRRISRGWKEHSRTDDHYREGTSVPVFDYRGKKCAIGLCGDVWDYPERFALGEEILFWPVYIGFTPEEWEKREKAQYAAQAQLCCERALLVNCICDAQGGAAFFHSGKVEAAFPMGAEGLLIVEV